MFLVCVLIYAGIEQQTHRQVPVNDKFMYVPIMGSLSSMFRNSELCNNFQDAKPHQEVFYRDINDGSYFRSHRLFSQEEHDLHVQLYYDNFENYKSIGFKTLLYLFCS